MIRIRASVEASPAQEVPACPAALTGPAVVSKRARVSTAAVTAPPPVNDDRKPAEKKSAIVTTTSRKKMKLERRQEDRPEDPDAASAMRAWLERAKWGRGPAG
jgi:hypothetical protein